MTLLHIWDMDGFEVPLITRCNAVVGNWLQSAGKVLFLIFFFQIFFLKMVLIWGFWVLVRFVGFMFGLIYLCFSFYWF